MSPLPRQFPSPLRRIVSGGQTGVDRGALDWALAHAVPCGGWCPAGRWAEDGALDGRYPLRETTSADPAERTRRNVCESDATLVLLAEAPAGGTLMTLACAVAIGRPLCVVVEGEEAMPAVRAAIATLAPAPDRRAPEPLVVPFHPLAEAASRAAAWIARHGVVTLNVAGPRASQWAGGAAAVRAFLGALAKVAGVQPGAAPSAARLIEP